MKRRDLALALAALPLLNRPAWAAVDAVEGRNFNMVAQPQPVAVPGKIEVLEFFGYWCPHCYAFESTLEAWVKRLPADVAFRRVPVAFSVPQQALQKAFYALEDIGQAGNMHRKIFAAIHQQNRRLGTESEIFEFLGSQGVDMAKFREAFGSFSATTRASRARQLSQDYKIDGVPALGVQGRFFTSGSLSGGNDRMVQVADFLIAQARQG